MRYLLPFLGVAWLSLSAAPAQAQLRAQLPDRNLDRNLADARLLRDIEPVQSATPQLMRLRPVRYHVQSPISGQLLGPLRLGFVAQQLQPVYPGMVLRDYDSKGTLRVEYGQLIPVLTRGFQEQEVRIQLLEAKLDAMNQELVQQRAENARLTVGLAAASAAPARSQGPSPAEVQSQIAELQRAVRQLQALAAQLTTAR
jgi:hypothetical protein